MQQPRDKREWLIHNSTLENTTRDLLTCGTNIRYQTEQTRNSVNNNMTFNQLDSNINFQNRIYEVEKWFIDLKRSAVDIKNVTEKISAAREQIQKNIMVNLPSLEIVKEVINLRHTRASIDFVDDEVNHELQKESYLIENINDHLRKISQKAFEHMMQLFTQEEQLKIDINHKEVSLSIDRNQLALTPSSVNDLMCITPCIYSSPIDVDSWLQRCFLNKRTSEELLYKSTEVLNECFAIIAKSVKDIQVQKQSTNLALSQRCQEILEVIHQLSSQRKDLQEELQRLKSLRRKVQQDLNAASGNLKLAQTRLDNRNARHQEELVRDNIEISLQKEFKYILEGQEYLMQNLQHIKTMFSRTEQQLDCVEKDLQLKQQSLVIDKEAVRILESPNSPWIPTLQHELH